MRQGSHKGHFAMPTAALVVLLLPLHGHVAFVVRTLAKMGWHVQTSPLVSLLCPMAHPLFPKSGSNSD